MSKPEVVECWCLGCKRVRIVSILPEDTVADLLSRLGECTGCETSKWAMHDVTGKHTIVLQGSL